MATFTPGVGDIFLASSDQIGATQTSTLNPDGTLTLVKDENAGSSFPAVTSVTIDTMAIDQRETISFGGGPPEVVLATTYTVSADTTFGPQSLTIDLLGTDDTGHALVADSTIPEGIVLSSVGQTFGSISDTFTPAFVPACFAGGTHILTAAGEVLVEALREGDTVVSAFGECVPVQWLGHRDVDCTQQPRPQDVWPVRVRAGAFGKNLPHRDLLISPDHAVFVSGVLIPIRYLINAVTIVQEPVDAVTYWHVELPEHDVLIAEGLPAESYLDTGNRDAFANADGIIAARNDEPYVVSA